MFVNESLLRKILDALTQLEEPTPKAIAAMLKIPEDCVRRCLRAAEKLGLVERA